MRCRFFLQRVARDRIQGSLLEHKSRSLSDAPRPPPRVKPSPPTLSDASPPPKGRGTAHGAPNDHAGTFAARLATAAPLWIDPSNNGIGDGGFQELVHLLADDLDGVRIPPPW